jgi:hypothetical protein
MLLLQEVVEEQGVMTAMVVLKLVAVAVTVQVLTIVEVVVEV